MKLFNKGRQALTQLGLSDWVDAAGFLLGDKFANSANASLANCDIRCLSMANGKRDKGNTHEPGSETASLDIGSVVAAFSEEQVERITKLTKGRLRYWAATGFFGPSFVEEEKHLPFSRFYSFKDIVALRTLEMLRVQNNVPLQHLRKVAERLSHLADQLWISAKLFIVNRKVVVASEGGEYPEEVLTGQYVFIPLRKVIVDTEADVIAFKKRPTTEFGRLSRNRGVIRNALVVSGTRISVTSIFRLHEDGYSNKQIIAEYPDLTESDVAAAIASGAAKAA